MKSKCYRSKSESRKPHMMKMIFESSDSGSNIVFRRCSCKAGQGHLRHLCAVLSSELKESDSASACTAKLQQ